MAKATKKAKTEFFTTPPLKATMVFLNEPSTKFKKEGEYSVKCVGTADDYADLITRADRMIEEKVAEVLKADPKLKKVIKTVKPTKPEYDDEGDETGNLQVNFKRAAVTEFDGKRKVNTVKLLDTEGNKVTDPIWGGTTLMVRYFMSPYFSPKDKEVGVSCKITHAVIVDLVSAGGADEDPESLGFAKVSGYKTKSKAKDDDADDESEDDENNSSASDDEGGDADF